MATLTKVPQSSGRRIALVKRREKTITKWMPRRCTVISTSLIIAGMAIPLLMAVQVLPITFLLGLATLVLLGAGCGLLLTSCGEV